MKFAFLGSADSWYFRDLQRACASDHELVPVTFRDMRADISNESSCVVFGDQPAADFNAILVRVMPPGSLEQVVFRMDALMEISASGVLVTNPPKAIEAAVDKYLSLARLARAGIIVPPTLCCQTVEQAMDAFEVFDGDVLIKPIFGGEGRGIVRASDKDLLYRCLRSIETFQSVIYVQKFIAHRGFDLRLFVLGDDVFAMRREGGGNWKTNISAGGRGVAHEPSVEEIDLAKRATTAIGADIAGVDVVVDEDGQRFVLEVNAVPGWRALQRATGVDVAEKIVRWVVKNADEGGTRRD